MHKEIFDSACRYVNKLILCAKKSFFIKKFQCLKTLKELFSNVNILFGKKSDSSLPDLPDIDNANNFSKYFIEKIDKIREDLDSKSCPDPTFSPFSKTPLSSFDPVTEDEVRKIILDSPSKHCDLDPLPTTLLKESLNCLLPSITCIINDSLLSGDVPKSFENALVKPLLKKPGLDPNIFKNYRPVSNLPFLSKILEKVVLKRLLAHLNLNELNEIYQSAYKKNHLTETALLKIFNDIALPVILIRKMLLSFLSWI